MINSTAYYNDFWNEMRGKQAVTDSLYNNRESKTNAYHLPGESNKKYTAVLQKESAVRQLATVVNATRSDSRLWTFDCEGQAEWGDMVNLEGMDNEDDFQRFEVQAYRLSDDYLIIQKVDRLQFHGLSIRNEQCKGCQCC